MRGLFARLRDAHKATEIGAESASTFCSIIQKTVLFLTLAIFASGASAAGWDILISVDAGAAITSKDGVLVHDFANAVNLKKEIPIKLQPGVSFDMGATTNAFSWVLASGDKALGSLGFPFTASAVQCRVPPDTYPPLGQETMIHVTSDDSSLFDSDLKDSVDSPAVWLKSFWVSPKGAKPFSITFTPEIQSIVEVISFDGIVYAPSHVNKSKDMAITFKFTVEITPEPIKSEDRKKLVENTDVKLDDTGKVDLDSVKSTGTTFDKSKAVAIPMFTASVDVGGVVSGISADLSGKIPGATPASFGAGGGAVLYKVLASGQLKALSKVDSPSKEGEYSVSGTANDMKFNVWINDRSGDVMTSIMPDFDFNGAPGVVADPLVVSGATTTTNNPSKGSSSGCNVVSTPLWLLTALPLVFMRRRK